MVGLLPVGIAAYAKGEIDKLPLLGPLGEGAAEPGGLEPVLLNSLILRPMCWNSQLQVGIVGSLWSIWWVWSLWSCVTRLVYGTLSHWDAWKQLGFVRISNLHDLYKSTFSPKVFTPALQVLPTGPNPQRRQPPKTFSAEDKFYIGMTCIIGLTISYTSIWAQSLISATQLKQKKDAWAGLGSVRGKCILYIYIYIYMIIYLYIQGVQKCKVFLL